MKALHIYQEPQITTDNSATLVNALAEIERLKAEREMLTLGRLTVGPYTLRKTTSSGYWLQHESGEGMGIQAETVLAAIEELWKDF